MTALRDDIGAAKQGKRGGEGGETRAYHAGPSSAQAKPGQAPPNVSDSASTTEKRVDVHHKLLKKLVDQRDFQKKPVDQRDLPEVDRQRFSLPPARLVYDAFVAFYKELEVSPLRASQFCPHALHFRCYIQRITRKFTITRTNSA